MSHDVQDTWDMVANQNINTRPLYFQAVHQLSSMFAQRGRYHSLMYNQHNLSPELQQHLSRCQREYLRRKQAGFWPWSDQPDSTLSEDLVESQDNPKIV